MSAKDLLFYNTGDDLCTAEDIENFICSASKKHNEMVWEAANALCLSDKDTYEDWMAKAQDLGDFMEALQSPYQNWSAAESNQFIDYFRYRYSLVCCEPPPEAPTLLTVTAVSSSQINGSFTDNTGGTAQHEVWRSLTSGFGFSLIDTLPAGEVTFEDTGRQEGTQYCYKIRAKRNNLFSEFSIEACATTPIPFTFTINTENLSTGSSATKQFKLPLELAGVYNFFVEDWGDGSSDTITAWDQAETTHTYTGIGTYTIKIIGTIQGWKFNNTGDRLKILTISKWGDLIISNSDGVFRGCSNLNITATDVLDVSSIEVFQNLFNGCSSLTTPDFSGWNTSNVNTLVNCFQGCSSFNGNVTTWDVSGVTNMQACFDGCTVFNQDISPWNVSSVTVMTQLFRNCSAFNQNIDSWNTISCFALTETFRGATSFNQSLNSWNLSSLINLTQTFQGATSFNQSLNSWNVSSVTSFFLTFDGATAFNGNITSWNTSSGTVFNSMFQNASAFNQNISLWNTGAGANFSNMFFNATSFDQNLGSWNVTSMTAAVSMFFGVTLSTTNYSNILIGWEAQVVQNNVVFGGGNSTYSAGAAATARAALIADHTWTITDGGPA